MRNARYALRTLVGPWFAVAVVGLEVANLIQRGAPWRGEFLWTAEWMAIALFITGPAIAGVSAVDASRISRKGAMPVVAVAQRPHAPYLFAIAWAAAPASVVHLLAFVGALTIGGAFPQGAPEAALVILGFVIQLAAIWWYTALGSAIGRFVSPVAAGISATVVALAAFYTFSWGPGFRFLDFGAATVSRLGVSLRWQYLLLQGAVMILSSILLLRLAPPTSEGRHEFSWRQAVLLLSLPVLLVGTHVFGPDHRTQVSASIAPNNCYFVEPHVCLYTSHLRIADHTVGSIAEVAEAARRGGYAALVPTAVHEQSWSYRPPDAETRGLPVPTAVLAGSEWDLLQLIQLLLVPSHCPQVFGDHPPPDRYFSELEALTFTWVRLVENPRSQELEDIPPSVIEASILTPAEAREAKAYLDSCEF